MEQFGIDFWRPCHFNEKQYIFIAHSVIKAQCKYKEDRKNDESGTTQRVG